MKKISFVFFLFFVSPLVHAKIYWVTNNSPTGEGSLGAAIDSVNSHPGKDSIYFNISSSSVEGRTIAIKRLIRFNDAAGVTIDGTTQADGKPFGISAAKIFLIIDKEIRFEAPHCEIDGICISGNPSNYVPLLIVVKNDSCRIGRAAKGNIFIGSGIAIQVNRKTGAVIQGNILGLDTSGNVLSPHFENAIVLDKAEDVMIGGSGNGEGNIISGNYYGIIVGSGENSTATIYGNYIGTDISGNYARPNDFGIDAISGNYTIGGPDPGMGNIISGNTGTGIVLGAGGTIQGNKIGLNADGTAPLPNGTGLSLYNGGYVVGGNGQHEGNFICANMNWGIGMSAASYSLIEGNNIGIGEQGQHFGNGKGGIYFSSRDPSDKSFGVIIGGTVAGAENIIAYNQGPAILYTNRYDKQNSFLGNSIFCNENNGNPSGILLEDGNKKIKPPKILQVTDSSISGIALSLAHVEAFGNDSCFDCEGQHFLGSVNADSNGYFSFIINYSSSRITATQSTSDGTSEFTDCYYPDFGSCLKAAISFDSKVCANDTIQFFNATQSFTGDTMKHWTWYFDYTNESHELNPKYVFNKPGRHYVFLIVDDGSGCIDSAKISLKAGGGFNPGFSVDSLICMHSQAEVKDSTTGALYKITRNILEVNGTPYYINFDGVFSFPVDTTPLNLVHIVTDKMGCSVTSDTVTVSAKASPKTDIAYTEPCIDEPITFYNRAADDDTLSSSYTWRFDDGFISSDDSVIRTFDSSFYREVTLTLTADQGCMSSQKLTFDPTPENETHFTTSVDGVLAIFTNTSTDAYENSFKWDLGDGTISTSRYFFHYYQQPGVYYVTLQRLSFVCADTNLVSDTISILPVGMENVSDVQHVDIFPNPASNNFSVKLSRHENISLIISGEEGKILREVNLNGNDLLNSVDVSTLPDGIYYLRFFTHKGVETKKIAITNGR